MGSNGEVDHGISNFRFFKIIRGPYGAIMGIEKKMFRFSDPKLRWESKLQQFQNGKKFARDHSSASLIGQFGARYRLHVVRAGALNGVNFWPVVFCAITPFFADEMASGDCKI